MRKDRVAFLRKLVDAPSPSGFEQPVQRVVRAEMKKYTREVRTDVHGNVIGIVNPHTDFRVMLAGHCDEIGMMVMNIDDNGYIYSSGIGGVDAAIVPTHRVVIHSEKGPVLGAFGRRAIHLARHDDSSKGGKLHDMWIDIGAKNKKEAEKLVSVGDPVTFAAEFAELRNHLALARGFDDKVGSFVVVETLRLLQRKKLSCGVYGVSTVQEELGLRGARTSAFGIDPQVGIAIDVTHATDYPKCNKNIGGDIKLGEGPVLHRGANINPVLGDLLIKTAKQRKIPYQISGAPSGTGTDANVIQLTRAGVATGLISIPNRYMHTPVEIVSLDDLENAARLLAAVIEQLKPKMDFTP
ncbi:MAG: M42 family metallopeptidase [Planctomycetes bacterium]|nr:M42 family metallopeptidase [Planctomycetota bacterium]